MIKTVNYNKLTKLYIVNTFFRKLQDSDNLKFTNKQLKMKQAVLPTVTNSKLECSRFVDSTVNYVNGDPSAQICVVEIKNFLRRSKTMPKPCL